MLVGKCDLLPGCFGQEVDDDLPHLFARPAVKVSHALHEPGKEAGVPDTGFLAQLAAGRCDRVLSRLDVALGEIPVRAVVEEEVFAALSGAKQDHAGGHLVSHGAYIPRGPRLAKRMILATTRYDETTDVDSKRSAAAADGAGWRTPMSRRSPSVGRKVPRGAFVHDRRAILKLVPKL